MNRLTRPRLIVMALLLATVFVVVLSAAPAKAVNRLQQVDTETPTPTSTSTSTHTPTPFQGGLSMGVGVPGGQFCGGIDPFWTYNGYWVDSEDDTGAGVCTQQYKSVSQVTSSGSGTMWQNLTLSQAGIYTASIDVLSVGASSFAHLGFGNCSSGDIGVVADTWTEITVQCYIPFPQTTSISFGRRFGDNENLHFDNAELNFVTSSTPTPGASPSLIPTWTRNPDWSTITPWPTNAPVVGFQNGSFDVCGADIYYGVYFALVPPWYGTRNDGSFNPYAACRASGAHTLPYSVQCQMGGFACDIGQQIYLSAGSLHVSLWYYDSGGAGNGIRVSIRETRTGSSVASCLAPAAGGWSETSCDITVPIFDNYWVVFNWESSADSGMFDDIVLTGNALPPTAVPTVGAGTPTLVTSRTPWSSPFATYPFQTPSTPIHVSFQTPQIVATGCFQIGPLDLSGLRPNSTPPAVMGVRVCTREWRASFTLFDFTIATDLIAIIIAIAIVVMWLRTR